MNVELVIKLFFKSILISFIAAVAFGNEEPLDKKRKPANYLNIKTLKKYECNDKDISNSLQSTLSDSHFQIELILNTYTKQLLTSVNYPEPANSSKRISEVSDGLLANITYGKPGKYNARFVQFDKDQSQAQVYVFSDKGTKIVTCLPVVNRDTFIAPVGRIPEKEL
jgi:hypothetical protein